MRHKRFTSTILTLGVAMTVAGAIPATAYGVPVRTQAPSITCAVVWGSQPKQLTTGVDDLDLGSVSGVRTGRHDCYDRLVIDVTGGDAGGYLVQYVDEIWRGETHRTVALRGGAKLYVAAYGTAGLQPVDTEELADVAGYRTLRQVAVGTGLHSRQSDFGVGVRARLPFRVFILDGPAPTTRIVVDVAHHW